MSNFSDPAAVARYAESPVRQVPGFHALQKMTELLLAECVPDDGNVLVVGAGGGLELKVFADAHAGWRYCGVDPSAEMLDLAKRTLGDHAARVDFHHGYVDTAPDGPFTAATCLLTLHFIPEAERLRTLKNIHRRLKPGAPLVVAHYSIPQGEGEKLKWLARYAAFAIASGAPIANAETAIATINERLPILTPDRDEALLRETGFSNIGLFYAAFTFRGWVATRV